MFCCFPRVSTLCFYQNLQDLLKKTNLISSKASNTPLVSKHDLHASGPTLVDHFEYQSMVGALQYLLH